MRQRGVADLVIAGATFMIASTVLVFWVALVVGLGWRAFKWTLGYGC